MKVISKKDLILLIPLIDDRDSFDLDDFKIILDRFGDDYYVFDGIFQKVQANEEMDKIRHGLYEESKDD